MLFSWYLFGVETFKAKLQLCETLRSIATLPTFCERRLVRPNKVFLWTKVGQAKQGKLLSFLIDPCFNTFDSAVFKQKSEVFTKRDLQKCKPEEHRFWRPRECIYPQSLSETSESSFLFSPRQSPVSKFSFFWGFSFFWQKVKSSCDFVPFRSRDKRVGWLARKPTFLFGVALSKDGTSVAFRFVTFIQIIQITRRSATKRHVHNQICMQLHEALMRVW